MSYNRIVSYGACAARFKSYGRKGQRSAFVIGCDGKMLAKSVLDKTPDFGDALKK